jgi:hypothetical protein
MGRATPDPSRQSERDLDRSLRAAIEGRRVVTFTLDGRHRVAEPHDYGIVEGQRRLFFYQVGGESRSGRGFGWRWAALAKMSDLQLRDERFAGSRPAPSGKHQRWDEIIASVSVRPTRGGEAGPE